MKISILTVLAVLCTLTASAQVGTSAAYQGRYFGFCIPTPNCSNERLIIELNVGPDGDIIGEITYWEGGAILVFEADWPLFDKGRFKTNVTGMGDSVTGKFSKAGMVTGTIKVGGGCTYSYKAYRRYRVTP